MFGQTSSSLFGSGPSNPSPSSFNTSSSSFFGSTNTSSQTSLFSPGGGYRIFGQSSSSTMSSLFGNSSPPTQLGSWYSGPSASYEKDFEEKGSRACQFQTTEMTNGGSNSYLVTISAMTQYEMKDVDFIRKKDYALGNKDKNSGVNKPQPSNTSFFGSGSMLSFGSSSSSTSSLFGQSPNRFGGSSGFGVTSSSSSLFQSWGITSSSSSTFAPFGMASSSRAFGGGGSGLFSSGSPFLSSSSSIFSTPGTSGSMFSSFGSNTSSAFSYGGNRSLFGSPSTNLFSATSSSSSFFGQHTSSSMSLFGQPKQQGLFSFGHTSSSSSSSSPSSSLFGRTSTFLFGTTSSSSSFGSGAFGMPSSNQTSIFGRSNNTGLFSQTTSSSMFGASSSTSLFGSSSSTSTFGSLFGASSSSSSLFGGGGSSSLFQNMTSSSSTSLFGNQSSSIFKNSIFGVTSSSLFGQTSSSSLFGGFSVTSSSLFGSSSPFSSLFGQTSSSSLFGPFQTSSINIFGTPSQSSSSLFGQTQATINPVVNLDLDRPEIYEYYARNYGTVIPRGLAELIVQQNPHVLEQQAQELEMKRVKEELNSLRKIHLELQGVPDAKSHHNTTKNNRRGIDITKARMNQLENSEEIFYDALENLNVGSSSSGTEQQLSRPSSSYSSPTKTEIVESQYSSPIQRSPGRIINMDNFPIIDIAASKYKYRPTLESIKNKFRKEGESALKINGFEVYQVGYIHALFTEEIDLKKAVIGRDIQLKVGDINLGKDKSPFYGKRCIVKFDSPPLELDTDYQKIKDYYNNKGWKFVEFDRGFWVFEINSQD